MRAPKCSRPEPNKPSQTHEHGLSKEKKVSFQISIFLSPAVLSFYCFPLCAVVPALAGQPGSTFTFANLICQNCGRKLQITQKVGLQYGGAKINELSGPQEGAPQYLYSNHLFLNVVFKAFKAAITRPDCNQSKQLELRRHKNPTQPLPASSYRQLETFL